MSTLFYKFYREIESGSNQSIMIIDDGNPYNHVIEVDIKRKVASLKDIRGL